MYFAEPLEVHFFKEHLQTTSYTFLMASLTFSKLQIFIVPDPIFVVRGLKHFQFRDTLYLQKVWKNEKLVLAQRDFC